MRGTSYAGICLLLALTSPVRADEKKALERLQEGVTHYNAGEWEAAERAFSEAQKEAPDRANPYRWLGLTAVQRDDCPAAIPNLQKFLDLSKPDDARQPEVEQLMTACRDKMAKAEAAKRAAESAGRAPSGQGAIAASSVEAEQAKKKRVKRKWIWGVVAGSAAAAAGIAVGASLGSTRDPVPTQGTTDLR